MREEEEAEGPQGPWSLGVESGDLYIIHKVVSCDRFTGHEKDTSSLVSLASE